MMSTVNTGLGCAGCAHDPGKNFSQKKYHSLGLGRYLIRLGEKPTSSLLKAKLLQGTAGKICKMPGGQK